MTHLVWDEGLELGVPALDAQHRQLFALRNELEDCCLAVDADDSLRFHDVLAELYNYSITHFAAEEAYMKLVGYPGFAAHVTEHLRFIEVLADFNWATAQGNGSASDTLSFLSTWLVAHIQRADGAIRKFVEMR